MKNKLRGIKMKNKLLSEQICEICGIPFEKSVNMGWTYPKYKYTHLDFSEPENFCKLADLPIKTMYNKTIFWLVTEENLCEDREDFLGKLYEILKKVGLTNYHLEAIKQSIREAEWKYE